MMHATCKHGMAIECPILAFDLQITRNLVEDVNCLDIQICVLTVYNNYMSMNFSALNLAYIDNRIVSASGCLNPKSLVGTSVVRLIDFSPSQERLHLALHQHELLSFPSPAFVI